MDNSVVIAGGRERGLEAEESIEGINGEGKKEN